MAVCFEWPEDVLRILWQYIRTQLRKRELTNRYAPLCVFYSWPMRHYVNIYSNFIREEYETKYGLIKMSCGMKGSMVTRPWCMHQIYGHTNTGWHGDTYEREALGDSPTKCDLEIWDRLTELWKAAVRLGVVSVLDPRLVFV